MQPPFWERACPSHRTGSLRSRYRFRIIKISPNRIKRINQKLTKPDYHAAPWNWRIRDGRLQLSTEIPFGRSLDCWSRAQTRKFFELVHSNGFNSPSMVGINSDTVG